MSVVEGLPRLLEDSGHKGLLELREGLSKLVNHAHQSSCLIDQQRLNQRVYRLRFEIGDRLDSFIVKRLEPHVAQRIQLAVNRWLPAVGLDESGPGLLATLAERGGDCVWHVYEDLGDWALDSADPESSSVAVVVKLIARIHTRFAKHPLLAECRLHGGELGIPFYAANVRDAIHGLMALEPPVVELPAIAEASRGCLLERLHSLLDEEPHRAQLQADLGGYETLLHGDLWTSNVFVIPTKDGLRARLIDWDHVGVGSFGYDLSTLLLRYPREHRPRILEQYRDLVADAGWRLPGVRDLNVLFETAEYARYANRVIWASIALLDGEDWGFDELTEIERWFETFQPVLPEREDI
ncbi:MAG TPA: phosphotransferase [Vicinamibacteria bacterium]|nr:phosphotransferase [Vicinamibacteria bacterium]